MTTSGTITVNEVMQQVREASPKKFTITPEAAAELLSDCHSAQLDTLDIMQYSQLVAKGLDVLLKSGPPFVLVSVITPLLYQTVRDKILQGESLRALFEKPTASN